VVASFTQLRPRRRRPGCRRQQEEVRLPPSTPTFSLVSNTPGVRALLWHCRYVMDGLFGRVDDRHHACVQSWTSLKRQYCIYTSSARPAKGRVATDRSADDGIRSTIRFPIVIDRAGSTMSK
jgi:hypothetical protein